jgi:hypothetical protein
LYVVWSSGFFVRYIAGTSWALCCFKASLYSLKQRYDHFIFSLCSKRSPEHSTVPFMGQLEVNLDRNIRLKYSGARQIFIYLPWHHKNFYFWPQVKKYSCKSRKCLLLLTAQIYTAWRKEQERTLIFRTKEWRSTKIRFVNVARGFH